jgi:hypothetical protein
MTRNYVVQGEVFPVTLKGLTDAIKLGKEFAYSGPVDVLKIAGEQTTVAYTVPYTPQRSTPRKGYRS